MKSSLVRRIWSYIYKRLNWGPYFCQISFLEERSKIYIFFLNFTLFDIFLFNAVTLIHFNCGLIVQIHFRAIMLFSRLNGIPIFEEMIAWHFLFQSWIGRGNGFTNKGPLKTLSFQNITLPHRRNQTKTFNLSWRSWKPKFTFSVCRLEHIIV